MNSIKLMRLHELLLKINKNDILGEIEHIVDFMISSKSAKNQLNIDKKKLTAMVITHYFENMIIPSVQNFTYFSTLDEKEIKELHELIFEYFE